MANNKLEVKSGTLKLPPGTSTSDGSLGEIRMNVSGELERYNGVSWVALASGTTAADISFDNTASGLTATDVQAAIDEVEGRLDTAETNISNKVTGPASAADYNLASFDGTTGKLVRDSGVAINATFDMSGINDLAMTGDLDASDALVVDLANTNTASTVTVGGGNGGNAINIGTGTGANVINIGGANSTINMAGTVNNQNVTNLDVDDKLITINKGGAAASGGVSGIEVEENAVITGYVETSADRNSWAFKAPNTNGVATLTPGAAADDVVLRQATQTLTGKTIDGDDNTVQDLALTSLKTVLADASKFIVRDASGIPVSNTKAVPSGVVVGTTDAQVLTAKDIDGGTASDTSRITIPKNTTSNLNALTRKEATIVYDTDTNTLKYDDGSTLNEIGSGSGAGRVNFLTGDDTNFKNSVGNYTTFDEGAVSTPVDLTGGSASVVSAARSTAFDSTGGLRISHSAADGQGEGVTVPITTTLESKYLSSVMDIEFTYKSSSGYADDKLEVWVYDVTNATLIQPSNYKIKASTVPNKFKAQFQTSSNGTSYRLGFFCPNTTATAYDLDIDDVVVGPSIYNYGMPAFDSKSFTPTGSWVSNTTYSGMYSRQGEFASAKIKLALTGAPTATNLTVNLPFTIDTAKLNTDILTQPLGFGVLYDSSAGARYGVKVTYNSSTSVALRYDVNSSFDDASVNSTTPWTWASGDLIEFDLVNVPVLGWSSSVQMSSDADQRVCNFSVYKNTDQTGVNPNNSAVKLQFDTKSGSSVAYDTHGAFDNITNYRFTAQTSGEFEFSGFALVASTNVLANIYQLRLHVNGSWVRIIDEKTPPATTRFSLSGSAKLKLNAGDYVELYFFGAGNNSASTLTIYGGSTTMLFSGFKIQGPSAIGATETISAQYTGAGPTGTLGAAWNVVKYGTKVKDSHGSYDTSTGVYTIKAAGDYYVDGKFVVAGTFSADQQIGCSIYVNGSAVHKIVDRIYGAPTDVAGRCFGLLPSLKANDTVEIRSYCTGSGLSFGTEAASNTFTLHRVGI